MNNIKFLHGMYGGKNGGVNIASPCTTGDYDFIIVESGVTLTVLADAAVARVDVIHLGGTKGTATILNYAVSRTLTVVETSTLTAQLATFVSTNAAAYLAAGSVLTSSGTDLIFTANVAGTTFTGSTTFTNLTGNLTGGVELKVANHTAVNLLAAKNLGSVAFTADRILSAGTGYKVKTLTFSGGLVWGYTLETSTL
jgi:hypothetical protein